MFEFDGNTYTEAEMLDANRDAPEFCAWVRTAQVGDTFDGCTKVAA